MLELNIAPVYLAIYGLIFVVLSFVVIQHRRSKGVSVFTKNQEGQEDQYLAYKMRAHSNFAEYAPMVVLLLFALELKALPVWMIHTSALLFLSGRLCHAYSFLFIEGPAKPGEKVNRSFRVLGMVLTFSSIIGASIRLLLSYALT